MDSQHRGRALLNDAHTAEWPDDDLLVLRLAELARAFADAAPQLSAAERRAFLHEIEVLMDEGREDQVRQAVATGFL